MKVIVSLLALSGATAFAPLSGYRATTQLKSESEPAEEAPVVEEPPAPAPAPATPSKVPCFGASPFLGGKSFFLGEGVWDKLTMEWGSESTGTFLRAAELKHGRSAMIATTGFAFQKFGLTLDNISPHEYLSVTQGVKFADLAAMSPIDAIKAVPPEGLAQMFCAIALVEFYELTHSGGKLAEDETVAPGLQPGGLTGDLGWNPLGIEITDRRRLVELQNGRAAMFAISAWVSHEAISGSVPLFLPWN